MFLQLARKILSGGVGEVDARYVQDLIRCNRLDDAERLACKVRGAGTDPEIIQDCLLGEIAFRRGNDSAAEERFRRALMRAPGCPDAHYGLSLVMAEAGNLDAALEHALFARTAAANEARFLAQLGYCYVRLELYPAAEAPLRAALKLEPKDKHGWNNLGVVLRARPHIAEAKACFLQALELDHSFKLAQQNLERIDQEIKDAGWQATVVDLRSVAGDDSGAWADGGPVAFAEIRMLLAQGRVDEAVRRAELIVDESGLDAELGLALARTYIRAAEHDSALDVLQMAAELFPDDFEVRMELARLLLVLERPQPAEEHLRKALELHPVDETALRLLGTALNGLERYQESADVFRQVVEMSPDTSQKKQLAAALIMACEYEEAIALYEELIGKGEVARNEVVGNFACALAYAGRLDEAQRALDEALSSHSYDPGLRMMRAIVHLLYERYGDGWDDYEWRNFSNSRNFRALPFDRWRGEPLEGKSIVVLAEQGLGDQVMFASCIEDLLKSGAKEVTVEAMDRVAKTLSRSLPCRVIPTRQKKDLAWAADLQADCYVRLADLPKYYRRSRSAFPAKAYLRPDPERQAHWRAKLAEWGPRPWVGISWKGGTEITRKVVRTVSTGQFVQMAQGLQATWINLQYGDVHRDVEDVRRQGLHLGHWPEAIQDLDEFAALVSVLDLVVTVCNTTVHYAGATGARCLVLAPKIPEWRYGLTYEAMPWYPDVTVLRQVRAGDWDELFLRAKREVGARLNSLVR